MHKILVDRLLDRGVPMKLIERLGVAGRFDMVNDSWIRPICTLDQQLSELYPDYQINQIKEKFGSLRYYTTGVGEEGRKLIARYEKESSRW